MKITTCLKRLFDIQPPATASMIAVVLAATQFANAQSPNTKSNTQTEAEYTLPAFEVTSSRDFGYRATNSITATGIGTEIYKTPISVSVITKDLMNDIGGAGLFREVLQYTSGVTTDSRDPNNYTIRGFLSPLLVNRIGGASRNPTADFIERSEVVKGPNSVFFGRVAPGGVVNVITLRPGANQETRIKAVGGSYDYSRLVIDHNQPITRTLSVRVACSILDREDGYYDWTYLRQNAGYGALTWHITDKLIFNCNFDYNESVQNQPHSGARSDYEYLANPSNIGVPITTWGATNRTPFNRPSITTFADNVAYLDGDKGNNSGPDNFKKDRSRNLQGELTAKPLEWLSLRFGAAQFDAIVETLEESGFPDPAGTFVAARPVYNGTHPHNNAYEGEAVGEFKTGLASHRVLVGVRYVENKDKTFSVAGNLVNWNNKTMGPQHLKQQFPTPWPVMPTSFGLPHGTENAYYAAYQFGVFDDRIKLLGGLRNTTVKNRANAGQPLLKTSETTPQAGVMWEPIKDFSVFANYSKTFEPQFQVDVFGNIAPNVQGTGKEIGMKTSYFDGRISGTVSVFEVLRAGEARRDFLRELALGVSPILIAGGSSRTRGSELEATFTPARNYQVLFAYTYLWEREIIKDTASPILVGRKLPMSPEHTFALWQRYTITSGTFKGLTVGGAIRHQSNISATLQPTFSIKLENPTPVDFLISYQNKLFKYPTTYQLNIKNVFDEKYHDSSSLLADPLTAYISVTYKL
ncbi:MAG: TonB-dependent receptor [Nibricoccus sp.]